MLYRPSEGRFKDNCIVWHAGRFYLFSMYTFAHDEQRRNEDFRNVWCATSEDGVHWESVGAVIENAPFVVFAMAVHEVDGRFLLNHGSFSKDDQNVIRFWESRDLLHWTYLGPDHDLRPDARWYDPSSRLDCMNVLTETNEGRKRYYGYATGPGGFLQSDDGIRWHGLPPGETIGFAGIDPPPTTPGEGFFEIGGCERIDGRYCLLAGWFNYRGYAGYNVFTFHSGSPTGPFLPDLAVFRLNGNSTRWVNLWARFCRTDKELLVHHYMYGGHTYETDETWLPPLKKADMDGFGHLRLAYWQGNDVVKGTRVPVDFQGISMTQPASPRGDRIERWDSGLLLETEKESASYAAIRPATLAAILEEELDVRNGIVVEGSIQITCKDRRLVSPSIGFYLEEKEREGTAILFDSYGRTRIGQAALHDDFQFDCEDEISAGCSAPAGISPHVIHTFRLLMRETMFEIYLDDFHVQTFNTAHEAGIAGLTPRRLGFLVQNGIGTFDDMKIWRMSLRDPAENATQKAKSGC
jgi:hypothetical protein